MKSELIQQQQDLCKKYQAEFLLSPKELKVGISLSVKVGDFPIHGLRHPIQGDTSGWHIWSGEYSEDSDFFKPLHIEHLKDWCPLIEKYLGLAPGWRFLITPEYEDVWRDKSLLVIK